MPVLKTGNTLLSVLVVFSLILFTVFFTKTNRYLYMASQHIAYGLGFNINHLASQGYVDFIKSQEAKTDEDAVFLNSKTNTTYLASSVVDVLGETLGVNDNKWIEVDLSEQRLYMKEGGNAINSFLVSTGKWSPTPQGTWRIWIKLASTRMKGGSKALGTFYDLPNVPYTMYYYQGYGIHGAYWHNNFGQPMSHGCINMKPEEAAIVFNWAQVGTRVIVRL
jgi:lipoprotein-anchoring transpeptidase ErfK/SrfK